MITRSEALARTAHVEQLTSSLSGAELLGFTAYGEARNQGIAGQVAVMQTVMARVKKRAMSIRAVCLEPYQYSCWVPDPNSSNDESLLLAVDSYLQHTARVPLLVQCLALGGLVATGTLLDTVKGATHYMTAQLYATQTVAWAKGQQPCAVIGAHVFFNTVV